MKTRATETNSVRRVAARAALAVLATAFAALFFAGGLLLGSRDAARLAVILAGESWVALFKGQDID